jgi:uncharacterized protein YhbP (UPF0306 family)
MTPEQIEQTIRTYLPSVAHMSLSTARDNRPRTFEVHFAFDDGLNLYFCSSKESQHSQDIRENPFVAGTIVVQHAVGEKVRAVYFEGQAEELQDLAEDDPTVLIYEKRFGFGPQIARAAREAGKARFYKISVSDFYLIDGLESNPPKKLHLPWTR